MSDYKVGVYTDNSPFFAGGSINSSFVHTWVVLYDDLAGEAYVYSLQGGYDFDQGVYGYWDSQRTDFSWRDTSSRLWDVSEYDFNQMKSVADYLYENYSDYSLFSSEGVYNCVTVSDAILSAWGINDLNGLWHPGLVGVFLDRLNASESVDDIRADLDLRRDFDEFSNFMSGFWYYAFNPSEIYPAVSAYYEQAGVLIPRRDPLALDLNRDGLIGTISTDEGITFDHGATGVEYGTGWINSSDAWLALDLNGNGVIDSGRELFGDNTIKLDGNRATDAFDALMQGQNAALLAVHA